MKIQDLAGPILIFVILLFPVSCNFEKEASNQKVVTVSILPFKFFVEGIAGDDYKVNVIVPPGASPATYEPPPSVIRSLQNSDLVIFNGYLGFEMAWMDKLMQVNPDIKSIYLANSQDLIAADAHRHGDHIHYNGVDPHFWMAPSSARQIALDLKEFLIEHYPADAELFNSNYTHLLSEIDDIDIYAKQHLAGMQNKTFLIFHPALTYFAREYDLVQIPIEFEGKEPSASWLRDVISMAREDSIKTIMVQQEFNRKSAETIALEIGAEVVDIFPLSDNWTEAMKDVIKAVSEAGSRRQFE